MFDYILWMGATYQDKTVHQRVVAWPFFWAFAGKVLGKETLARNIFMS